MTKKIIIPTATKGYGYCGAWKYGNKNGVPSIGWMVSPFVSGEVDKKYPSIANVTTNPHIKNERFFLCEIIIKPLKDIKGRPITKLVR